MSILNVLGCYCGFKPILRKVVKYSGSIYIERKTGGLDANEFDGDFFGVDYSGLFFRGLDPNHPITQKQTKQNLILHGDQ